MCYNLRIFSHIIEMPFQMTFPMHTFTHTITHMAIFLSISVLALLEGNLQNLHMFYKTKVFMFRDFSFEKDY